MFGKTWRDTPWPSPRSRRLWLSALWHSSCWWHPANQGQDSRPRGEVQQIRHRFEQQSHAACRWLLCHFRSCHRFASQPNCFTASILSVVRTPNAKSATNIELWRQKEPTISTSFVPKGLTTSSALKHIFLRYLRSIIWLTAYQKLPKYSTCFVFLIVWFESALSCDTFPPVDTMLVFHSISMYYGSHILWCTSFEWVGWQCAAFAKPPLRLSWHRHAHPSLQLHPSVGPVPGGIIRNPSESIEIQPVGAFVPSIKQEVRKTRSHLRKLFKGLKTLKTNSGPSERRAGLKFESWCMTEVMVMVEDNAKCCDLRRLHNQENDRQQQSEWQGQKTWSQINGTSQKFRLSSQLKER